MGVTQGLALPCDLCSCLVCVGGFYTYPQYFHIFTPIYPNCLTTSHCKLTLCFPSSSPHIFLHPFLSLFRCTLLATIWVDRPFCRRSQRQRFDRQRWRNLVTDHVRLMDPRRTNPTSATHCQMCSRMIRHLKSRCQAVQTLAPSASGFGSNDNLQS